MTQVEQQAPSMAVSAANDLLKSAWVGKTLPVDPFELCQATGLQLRPFFTAVLHYVPSDGMLCFNSACPFDEQRFTLAVGLGHHVLSHGVRFASSLKDIEASEDEEDQAAVRFAEALLVPDGSLRLLIEEHRVADFKIIVQHFNVPRHVVARCLSRLGYRHLTPREFS